jgi:RNA-directed DNA polymerase
MNAMERSDSSKVVKKQANKAALAAAEPVERRDEAKENADLQATVRTQSRQAVSQAQGRIRVAVTREQKREADSASASHRHKYVARKLPRLEEVCGTRCR